MLRALFVATTLWSASFFALSYDFPHILVTGYGEVKAKPDYAEVSLRVVESTKTAESAKAGVDAVVSNLTERMVELGIKTEDIDSANISLRPEYSRPDNGKTELVGYRATRSVTITVKELSLLDSLLVEAIEQGVNNIDAIRLLVSNEQMYRERARSNAVRDANQKAAALAKGFDKKLGEVWEINYQHRGQVRASISEHVAMDMSRKSQDYSDTTITISDDVHVTYRLD